MKERHPVRKITAKSRPYDREMEQAIRNYEIHWRKGEPLNEMRVHMGIPIVTREELAKKRDKAFKRT